MSTFISDWHGDHVAIPAPSTASRLAVQLYEKRVLQATLTCPLKAEEASLKALKFCGSTHLAGLMDSGLLIVWNLVRGVVVHQVQTEDEWSIEAVATTATAVYLLVLQDETKKLYIHQYSPETGKLVAKIKAGKAASSSRLGIAADTLEDDTTVVAVRNGMLVKLLNAQTGKKLWKCMLEDDAESGPSAGTILMNQQYVVTCTSASSNIVILSASTGTQTSSVALTEPPTVPLQLCEHLLLCDMDIYDVKTMTPQCILESANPAHLHLQASEIINIFPAKRNGFDLRLISLKNGQDELLESIDLDKQDDDDDAIMEDETTKMTSSTKRPAITTLGPGQAGLEALNVNDRPSKKSKPSEPDDGVVSEGDLTIAERLSRLQESLDEKDDDSGDEEEKEDKTSTTISKLAFKPKSATTESLSHLLHQALSSADDSMLELALHVRDIKVMENSLSELQQDQASLLLTKLTDRLARKPNRAPELAKWITSLLQSGKIRTQASLIPLRNLISERTDMFSQLLQLEGRLVMLSKMA